MFNWFDLMKQAQANAGFDALARQFQLSGEQQQKAMAAFMPAFLMGMQRAMTSGDPSQFMQSLMSGGYQAFWQAAGHPFSSKAQQDGKKLLDQLFGSDEISRRVAHQAADYAGISVDIMQQILPLLAGILAGGMTHWMMAQAQAAQGFSSSGAPGTQPQASSLPWVDLWSGWMKASPPGAQQPANPFEDMMTDFLRLTPAEQPAEQPKPSEPASSWAGMMEQGREMQMQYLTSLQSIFEEAWKVPPRKR